MSQATVSWVTKDLYMTKLYRSVNKAHFVSILFEKYIVTLISNEEKWHKQTIYIEMQNAP